MTTYLQPILSEYTDFLISNNILSKDDEIIYQSLIHKFILSKNTHPSIQKVNLQTALSYYTSQTIPHICFFCENTDINICSSSSNLIFNKDDQLFYCQSHSKKSKNNFFLKFLKNNSSETFCSPLFFGDKKFSKEKYFILKME